MISKRTIADFLDRPLDDHTWMKRLSEAELDAALARLDPKPELGEFGFHQKVGFLLGLSYLNFYYIYDMGTGKTRLMLRLLQYLFRIGMIKKWAFVLVMTNEAVLGWEDEILSQVPDLPYQTLLGDYKAKLRQLESFDRGVVIMTYMGYAAMVSDFQRVLNQKTRKFVNKRVLLPEVAREMADHVGALVMDEATALGHVATLTFNAVEPIAMKAPIRFSLSGRPFGRDTTVVWPQFFLMDHGASLGKNVGIFRETFFEKKKSYWGGPNAYEYKMKKRLQPEFARAIAHRSLEYSITECADLPEVIQVPSRVQLSAEAQQWYDRITGQLIEARGDFRVVENSFIRMRQITSGFMGYVDDETGERAEIEFKDNPKIEFVLSKLEEMPEGRKALIWHEYGWTGNKICEALEKRKIPYGSLRGGTKDWEETKDRLNKDKKFRALVISHRKGAFSLNLQAANYDFIVESPVSPIGREQLERRTWRQGQKERVWRFDVVAQGTVDERIRLFHKEGDRFMDALVRNPQKTLGLTRS